MAFKDKIKNNFRDCVDFKPYFFNRKFCKLSFKCENAGNEYILEKNFMPGGFYDYRCIGMMYLKKYKKTVLPKADPDLEERLYRKELNK